MTERPFSPDEFVRLLSLPEDHPERRRAESSGMLDAWRQMLREFENPPDSIASPTELADADAAIERRMTGVLAAPPRMRSGTNASGAAGPGFLAWLSATLFRPALRPAFALVALVVVAGGSWWLVDSRTPRAVRGVESPGGIVVEARTPADGTLELSWAPVAGADGYRVRFFGSTLREIARLEDLPEPKLRLERGSLPAGLSAGAETLVEVAAIRGGGVIAVSTSRAVRLP